METSPRKPDITGRSARTAITIAIIAAIVPFGVRATGDVTWTPASGGPAGGTVVRMRMVGGSVWASVYSGGIYRLDGSWSQIAIGRGMPENRAQDFAPDPTDPLTVYAPQIIACAARTTDGAASWTPLCDVILPAAAGDNFTAQTILVDPSDPQTIMLPGHNHLGARMLLVSNDGGSTWAQRASFDTPYDFNHMVAYGARLFLGTRDHGVLISDDDGLTWTPLNGGLTAMTTTRFVEFKGALYLSGGRFQFNVRAGGPLYRLNEAGTGWTATSGVSGVTGTAVSEDGTTLWIGTANGGVLRSTNGATFARVAPDGAVPGHVGEIVASGSTVYAGVGGSGIYRSTNGGASFAEFNGGLKAIATREVHVNPRNSANLYVVTWDRPGMYVSLDSGARFRRVGSAYNLLTLGPDPRAFTHFYAGGSVFVEGTTSSTGTVAFTRRTKPGPASSVVKSIAVHPANSAVVLAGIARQTAESQPGYGVYYSTNRGASWTKSSGLPSKAVHSIVFHRSSPTIVYVAALGGGIYRSTNTGRSFTRIGPAAVRYPYRLAMDPKNPKHLIAGTNLFFAGIPGGSYTDPAFGGGLWETTNGGSTWVNLTAHLATYPEPGDPEPFEVWKYNLGHQPNFEQIVIDPRSADHIIVGHHGESILATPDGGTTWRREDAGMVPRGMHNYGYCVAMSASGTAVYGCSCGRGLFRGSVPSTTAGVSWQRTGMSVEPEDEQPPPWVPATPEQAHAAMLAGVHRH